MSLPYLQPYLGLSNGLNTLHAAGGPGGAVGGWVELGRHTNASPDVTGLADKRYYMILHNGLSWSWGANGTARFNADSGSNYATRYNRNGTGETGTGSTTQGYDWIGTGGENQVFSVGYVANYASKEKLHIVHSVAQNTAGATNAPSRNEIVNKWANTSDPIDQVTTNTSGAGSELVVLGWDPADSHTNNFWEELASVDLSGGASSTLDSGTFTAKKYLWVQAYLKSTSNTNNTLVQLNNDTGSNYSFRGSGNGGADFTSAPATKFIGNFNSGFVTAEFFNGFIVNNASTEKLGIFHNNEWLTAGAGTAPNRIEICGKWANTSNQITSIQFKEAGPDNYATVSCLKVWGAD